MLGVDFFFFLFLSLGGVGLFRATWDLLNDLLVRWCGQGVFAFLFFRFDQQLGSFFLSLYLL